MCTTHENQGREPARRQDGAQQAPQDLLQLCQGKDIRCPSALLGGWRWDAASPAHVSVRMYRRIPLTTSSVSSLSRTMS